MIASEMHLSELDLDLVDSDSDMFLGAYLTLEKITNFEMTVNPHFKDWDPVLNLKKLKSSVHQIIKVCEWVLGVIL